MYDHLEKVVDIKPTYISLVLEIQSPKRHSNWGIILILCKTPAKGEELLLITKLEVLNLLSYTIINLKSLIWLLVGKVEHCSINFSIITLDLSINKSEMGSE